MRVTADIWVFVFLRRESDRGAFATIAKKGATEAGAIYVIENRLDETFCLYGPAPQSLITTEFDDRKFESLLNLVPEEQIEAYIAKLKNFDPDIWIVETECRQGPPSLELANSALKK
ncbi:MAG: DUF1491 family protein [Rhizobiaceae bacterium]|nr:DUF1491 family protein [Rhizobiaceae bacterium]